MNKLQEMINQAIDDCMIDNYQVIDSLIAQTRDVIEKCNPSLEADIKKLKKAEELKTFLTSIRKYFKEFEKLSKEQLEYIDRIYKYGYKKYINPDSWIEWYPASKVNS